MKWKMWVIWGMQDILIFLSYWLIPNLHLEYKEYEHSKK